jgi:preprotein translocase subunit SecG
MQTTFLIIGSVMASIVIVSVLIQMDKKFKKNVEEDVA